MTRKIVITVLMAATMLASQVALANHQVVVDPNDTPGRFDIRRVVVEGARPPVYTIRTFDGWRTPNVYDVGYFVIYFDTFGNERFDYYILVRSKGTRMQSTIWRDRKSDADVRIGYSRVSHPRVRVLKVRALIGKMRFGDARVQYRWQVRSLFINGKCQEKLCIDVAPNGAPVVEPVVPPPG